MKTRVIRWSLYALCFVAPVAVVLATADAPSSAEPVAVPVTAKAMGPDYIPDVVLTNHEGKQVRFYDDLIKGKIVVINFMYARCEGVCPGNTAYLRKVQ